MAKKVVFIGGGASNLIASILLKKKYPFLDVLLIEKNNQLGRKLKATGSGRCNIAPISDDISLFYNQQFVKDTIGEIPVKNQLEVLKTLGIITKEIKGVGYYPISESASNVVNLLQNQLDTLGIKYILNTKVIDYSIKDKYIKLDNNDTLSFDYLIFGIGGSSYSSLGGEDTLSNVFKSHGYKFNPQTPVLTPIKVKENVHKLFGIRLECQVTLRENNKFVYQEKGEVQFRKDGLSGIVILNISRFIDENKKYILEINPFIGKTHNLSKEQFKELYRYNKKFLLSILPTSLVEYGLSRLDINKDDIKENQLDIIYDYFSKITFNVSKLFPLEYATVSRGGIDVNQIKDTFESKIEDNVYFLGEIIDVDGPCGGYSLRFAISSSIIFSDKFTL